VPPTNVDTRPPRSQRRSVESSTPTDAIGIDNLT
jgi:hypothetical protein